MRRAWKRPVVDRRGNRMAHRIGNHAEDLCVSRDLAHAIDGAQLLRADLSRRGPHSHGRSRIGVETAERRRKHAVGKPVSPIARRIVGILGNDFASASTREVSDGLRAVVTTLYPCAGMRVMRFST